MTENYTINTAKVVAVCTSPKTGMRKKNVNEGILIEDLGIKNDAHANSETQLTEAKAHLDRAISYASAPVDPLPLFYGVIDSRTL